MIATTLVFLRAQLSRERFSEALTWIKKQEFERRLYLPDSKLWVLDLETNPEDPGFEAALDAVRDQGWTIVGTSLWDAGRSLRGGEEAISKLAELAVESRPRPNSHRNPNK